MKYLYISVLFCLSSYVHAVPVCFNTPMGAYTVEMDTVVRSTCAVSMTVVVSVLCFFLGREIIESRKVKDEEDER